MIKLEMDSKTGKGFVEGKSKNNDELMNEACNAVRGIVEYVAKTTNQTSKIEKGAIALTLFQSYLADNPIFK